MLYFVSETSQCTGCGACASICPVGCISLVSDEEGFTYPVADSTCIGCGECHDVCPVLGDNSYAKIGFEQFCVAARHLDYTVWERSSSGGAFSAICEVYCDDGDAIFGAKFEDLKVVHDYVRSVDEIESFMKSKYVQSDLRDSYREARELLKSGRRVLFSGTPCQVAGLRSFLGKEYANLLCVDLICHGVGSPRVFQQYVEYLEASYKSKLICFSFRNQRIKTGRFFDHIIRLEFENGTKVEDGSDPYGTGFIQCLFLRPSCSKCVFANTNRVGDITLGDFRRQHELLPEAKKTENLSTIIVNTEKGREVCESLSRYMDVYPVPLEDVVSTSLQLRKPSPASPRRKEFFDDLSSGARIEQVLQKYIIIEDPPGIMRRMWLNLPDRLRAWIKRRLRWIRR